MSGAALMSLASAVRLCPSWRPPPQLSSPPKASCPRSSFHPNHLLRSTACLEHPEGPAVLHTPREAEPDLAHRSF
eukprot:6731623-Prymnesium_polylepis.2